MHSPFCGTRSAFAHCVGSRVVHEGFDRLSPRALYDDGSVEECNEDNNVVTVPFDYCYEWLVIT
jgi:hypothetical protein